MLPARIRRSRRTEATARAADLSSAARVFCRFRPAPAWAAHRALESFPGLPVMPPLKRKPLTNFLSGQIPAPMLNYPRGDKQMNPMNLLQLKPAWDQFRSNHPKLIQFIKASAREDVMDEGTLIEINIKGNPSPPTSASASPTWNFCGR